PATATDPVLNVPPDTARTRLRHTANVLRSEFCKFRSVPSTFWTLIAAMASNLVIAALAAAFIPSHLSVQDKASTDAVRLSLAGIHLSQIAFGVLGALVITSEYSTGMIRATFAAVPQRRLVLTAKAAVFAAASLALGIASCVAGYALFEALLPSGSGLRSSLGDPGVLRAIVGGGLYLGVLGLLGLGIGAILRNSAGTIATLFGLLFVPTILISILPQSWQTTIGPYLPMNAGEQIYIAVHHEPHSLGPWTGFGVFCLYAAAALTAGFLTINRRDA
ncbi:MAG: ABC transporter permease, partial [Actinomycetota bacterium]|nr:ABC transporter permease [Actinomycetota bacterium]